MRWVERRAEAELLRLLGAARAVVVNGPRQAGKSALLRRVAAYHPEGGYVTLDDRTELRAARMDPVGFLSERTAPLFLDEFQRGGDPLLLALKARLDQSDERGQAVLAGSTRFLTEPRLSESLAGRVRFLDLGPLTQGEIDEGDDGLLEALFTGVEAVRRRTGVPLPRSKVAARIAVGGLPEPVLLGSERDRRDFFEGYVRTIVQRDVPNVAAIRGADELDVLWRVVAARTACELVPAPIGRAADLPDATARRYLSLLEAVFAFHTLRPLTANLTARVSGRPKLHLTDTGVAAFLLRETASRLADVTNPAFGPLLETFVVNELVRQQTWSETLIDLFHVRVHSGPEVDLAAVGPGGSVAGVEVKATASPAPDDARGLRWLAGSVGAKWAQGVIVCLVDRPVALAPDITAVPVSSVWRPA